MTRVRAGFSHMFVSDAQATWHNDPHTSWPTQRFLDMVAVVHSGTVRGGDLVVTCDDGTRVAAKMESGSIAMLNAAEHLHGSTAAITANEGGHRYVVSLYCEPRLLEAAELGDEVWARRFATWPPCPEDVEHYKHTKQYHSSAAAREAKARHAESMVALEEVNKEPGDIKGPGRTEALRAAADAKVEVARWAWRLPRWPVKPTRR